jgi:hypothetical protein
VKKERDQEREREREGLGSCGSQSKLKKKKPTAVLDKILKMSEVKTEQDHDDDKEFYVAIPTSDTKANTVGKKIPSVDKAANEGLKKSSSI